MYVCASVESERKHTGSSLWPHRLLRPRFPTNFFSLSSVILSPPAKQDTGGCSSSYSRCSNNNNTKNNNNNNKSSERLSSWDYY